MIEESITGVPPTFSAPALREWTELVEQVLRGIAHSLNNRATAVAAVLDLTRDPSEDVFSTVSILSTELERVQELVVVARAIGAPVATEEAFTAADAATDANRILGLHADLRGRAFTLAGAASPALRAQRWMLVRALVAFAAQVARNAPGDAPLHIDFRDEDDWLVVRSTTTVPRVVESRYAGELAAAMGGALLPDGQGFRVPTLAAIRRREGR